eukprot:SAG11_NODE_31912_length_288_cov_0.582011_1_plen_20_part_10
MILQFMMLVLAVHTHVLHLV